MHGKRAGKIRGLREGLPLRIGGKVNESSEQWKIVPPPSSKAPYQRWYSAG